MINLTLNSKRIKEIVTSYVPLAKAIEAQLPEAEADRFHTLLFLLQSVIESDKLIADKEQLEVSDEDFEALSKCFITQTVYLDKVREGNEVRAYCFKVVVDGRTSLFSADTTIFDIATSICTLLKIRRSDAVNSVEELVWNATTLAQIQYVIDNFYLDRK